MLNDPEQDFIEVARLLCRSGERDLAAQVMTERSEAAYQAASRALMAHESNREAGGDPDALLANVQAANKLRKQWITCTTISKWSKVRVTQEGARWHGKRRATGAAVPVGIEGVVQWTGVRTDWRGSGSYRYTEDTIEYMVKVGDRRFYTDGARLELVDDPWESLETFLAEEAMRWVPQVGEPVTIKDSGRTGTVFWVAGQNYGELRRVGMIPDEPLESDPVSKYGRTLGKKIVWTRVVDLEPQYTQAWPG